MNDRAIAGFSKRKKNSDPFENDGSIPSCSGLLEKMVAAPEAIDFQSPPPIAVRLCLKPEDTSCGSFQVLLLIHRDVIL
jgi:hypothetical protein